MRHDEFVGIFESMLFAEERIFPSAIRGPYKIRFKVRISLYNEIEHGNRSGHEVDYETTQPSGRSHRLQRVSIVGETNVTELTEMVTKRCDTVEVKG